MARTERLLEKARALFPELHRETVRPIRTVEPVFRDGRYGAEAAEDFRNRTLSTGDSVVLDFGDHETGYLTIRFSSEGAHPDAPVWIRVRFAERLSEFYENAEEYAGWISKAWIQETQAHLDVLPCEVTFPRRYAFRYVKLEVLDCSTRFSLKVEGAEATAVSSADESALSPCTSADPELVELDRIAVRTLHECMQKVFEDGPKRDRRLWMGDLRLEALVSYETYHADAMVKQGLYLFAGDTNAEGQIASNLFIAPQIEADEGRMFDYSLFFTTALRDYYARTGDREALEDLYETAMHQVKLAEELLGPDGVIRDSDVMGWCFVDWNLGLNKQASAQGIYLYALQAAAELAEWKGDPDLAAALRKRHADGVRAVREALWDQERGLFVSGSERQVSWASQCWLVLGGAFTSREEAAAALLSLEQDPDAEGMVTPYMYHHYIQALIDAGLEEKAKAVLKEYWGGMAADGADTFFELYRPGHPDESPYGGTIVNSYCHAWSCAPAYFIRHYQW
jgi:hypothetical protein